MTAEDRYPPIGDYAVIGDGRTAALISREGSIDWWCLPRFDGAATFGALLDQERGGRFAIRPTGRFDATRRYLPETNVLETTFTTDSGRVTLTDFMPALGEDDKRRQLLPERELLRRVAGVAGEVELELVCDPRPDYGRVTPRLRERGKLGTFWSNGREALVLRSDIPLNGRATVRAGERHWTALAYTDGDPAVLSILGDEAERRLEQSIIWWRKWSGTCRYEGRYREPVLRSALAVKLLAYAPSGAVLAAPTTSLPETPGGERNWDYRYCWLRDASLTIQALIDLGYADEGTAYLNWILHTTRRGRRLRVLYDVYGRPGRGETELDHLAGYRGARPVRIGNAAQEQLQLDVFGEVADATAEFVRRGGHLDRAARRMVENLGDEVCRIWRRPDHSIWELRTEPRHHTYSRVMCWVALDRILELHERDELSIDVGRYRGERAAIRDEVEARGWNDALGSYVTELGGDDVDASLLLLERYGYASPEDPRMRATCRRIHERLGAGPLLYRYLGPDGLPGEEGAFGIASFWGVECRARQGLVDEATRDFEALLGYANDVGLYAEEIDPRTGAHLGNFPQAFTHVGLIDAALTLAELTGEEAGHGTGTAEHVERAEHAGDG